MVELSLCADLSMLALIRDFVARRGRELGLPDSTVFELQLAVDEACTNVVKHAYGGACGRIELTIDAGEDCVCVVIRDWGAPFDPSSVPAPDVDAPLEHRPLGGLGLFLMKQLMDQVDFQFDGEQGNTLTMVKRLDRGAGQV